MDELERFDRVAALERKIAALPPCPWLAAEFGGEDDRSLARDAATRRRYFLAMDTHAPACAICGERERLVTELLEVRGDVVSRWIRQAVIWAYRRPLWLQPALTGAAFMGGLSLMRVIVFGLTGKLRLLVALLGLSMSAGIGFGAGLVGGNAYRLLRPKADEWGQFGPYLAGLLFAGTLGLATSLVLLAIPDSSEGFREGWAWKVVGVICLIIGPILGHLWFRPGKRFQL